MGKTAEFVNRYFHKGSAAVVHSRCQTRQYEDKNGNNRTAIEFVVDNIYFAGPKQDNQQGAADHPGNVQVSQSFSQGSDDDFSVLDDADDLPF